MTGLEEYNSMFEKIDLYIGAPCFVRGENPIQITQIDTIFGKESNRISDYRIMLKGRNRALTTNFISKPMLDSSFFKYLGFVLDRDSENRWKRHNDFILEEMDHNRIGYKLKYKYPMPDLSNILITSHRIKTLTRLKLIMNAAMGVDFNIKRYIKEYNKEKGSG